MSSRVSEFMDLPSEKRTEKLLEAAGEGDADIVENIVRAIKLDGRSVDDTPIEDRLNLAFAREYFEDRGLEEYRNYAEEALAFKSGVLKEAKYRLLTDPGEMDTTEYVSVDLTDPLEDNAWDVMYQLENRYGIDL